MSELNSLQLKKTYKNRRNNTFGEVLKTCCSLMPQEGAFSLMEHKVKGDVLPTFTIRLLQANACGQQVFFNWSETTKGGKHATFDTIRYYIFNKIFKNGCLCSSGSNNYIPSWLDFMISCTSMTERSHLTVHVHDDHRVGVVTNHILLWILWEGDHIVDGDFWCSGQRFVGVDAVPRFCTPNLRH